MVQEDQAPSPGYSDALSGQAWGSGTLTLILSQRERGNGKKRKGSFGSLADSFAQDDKRGGIGPSLTVGVQNEGPGEGSV